MGPLDFRIGKRGAKAAGVFRFSVGVGLRSKIGWMRCPFVILTCARHVGPQGRYPVTGFRIGFIGWPDANGIMTDRPRVVEWWYQHERQSGAALNGHA